MTTGIRFINYNTNQIADFDDAFNTDFAAAVSGNVANYALVAIITGGSAPPTPGVFGDLFLPWPSTITRWTLLGDQAGSAQLDIWMTPYTSYPPTVANTITGTDKPLFTTAIKGQSSALTGWTKAVPAASTMRFNLDSVATCTRLTLILELSKV